MLAYTPVSEAGGVGKTTSAANLAVAHARAGFDVLVVDMDGQDGCLSYLLGVDYPRNDASVDHLLRHLIGQPKGDLADLIHTVEGVDVIPSHNKLEDTADVLAQQKSQAEKLGDAFNKYRQLERVLQEAGVRDDYDVLVVDTPGKTGPVLGNALVAVRNVLVTLEPNAKGEVSIEGLDALVTGMEDNLGINIGCHAVLPVNVDHNQTEHKRTIENILDQGWSVPVTIGQRRSMNDGAWRQQCSLFTFVEEHRNRTRDRELETLEKYEGLARHLEQKAALEREVVV